MVSVRDVTLSGYLTRGHKITALEKHNAPPVYDRNIAVLLPLPTAVTLG